MKTLIDYLICGYYDSTCTKLSKNTYSQKRTVKHYEIEFFENDYFYTICNDKKIPLKSNTILIAKPNDVRYSKLHFKSWFIKFDTADRILTDILNSLPQSFKIIDTNKIKELFCTISKLATDIDNNEYLIISCLFNLLHCIKQDNTIYQNINKKKLHNNSVYITNAARYIENNYSNDISLGSIASVVSLSPNYFQTVFKKIYGVSPLKYLINTRINNAKHLLLTTELSITDIAFACGFNSQPYFNYVFKHEIGLTPLNFRSINKANL